MAAPTPSPEITKASTQMIRPTVASTMSLMESALTRAGPELKIFIYTSSAGACITPGAQAPHVYNDDSWNLIHPELVAKHGDNVPIFTSYPVAKINAEMYCWSIHKQKVCAILILVRMLLSFLFSSIAYSHHFLSPLSVALLRQGPRYFFQSRRQQYPELAKRS